MLYDELCVACFWFQFIDISFVAGLITLLNKAKMGKLDDVLRGLRDNSITKIENVKQCVRVYACV